MMGRALHRLQGHRTRGRIVYRTLKARTSQIPRTSSTYDDSIPRWLVLEVVSPRAFFWLLTRW
jgi:hypothetical protein